MAKYKKIAYKNIYMVSILEQCLYNIFGAFLLGFLLGMFMAMLMFNVPKNPKMFLQERNKGVKIRVDTKFITNQSSKNITLARMLDSKAKNIQGAKLAQRMRILCWVMTAKRNHKTKAQSVKRTWGRHCDKLLFFSETEDSDVPTIKIENVQSERYGLWTKVVGAYKYIHKYHREEYDWVLRADDDTYAIIENVREMLLPYSPNQPGYFGYRFLPHSPKGYFSGGGGVILSKEALDRVVTKAFDNKHNDCPNITFSAGDDDVKIG
ncbi:glycoprotein-N-acetylgalactosamine 3-beta-galactosyltransferase 1-like isoform X2 [Neocloeon triangulifer]|uniref:glycoprotein-N-acetylgalactosamine 3-beta-galactosyltransferase 1-like isoform X2 n=1 Tax=Neocloeon triangulifer TaxID=2078957 RepID=UPI00286EB8A6|nr:glycoprotein-N-acetylgalactosamine 3-beta-galactosyltransferase 1-like isoform X2 [Neocloeon triangulifer]